MFISHFNRYFEKHAKLTYFVLLVIIIATFVIFVTPGSMNGGQRGIKDYGKMYGKTLTVEMMQKEMAKTTLALWLANPQLLGADFSSQAAGLFEETLSRMRVLHYAKAKGMDKVTDDEVRARILKIEAIQDNGVFSKIAFDNLLEMVKNRLGMIPVEFDQVVREMIIMERVLDDVRGRVSVADSEIDDTMAQFTLKTVEIPLDPKGADPTEEDVQKYFTEHKAEIALPDSKKAVVAFFKYDAVRASLGDKAIPSDAEIEAYFNANKNTLYVGKELAAVKESIRTDLTIQKATRAARENAMKLSASFQSVAEGAQARFEAEAKAAGAEVVKTDWISLDNMIVGFAVSQDRLAEAIRNVAEINGVTSSISTDKYAAVAMVVDKQATPMPDALPEAKSGDALRRIISEAIIREKALAFFATNVKAPYDSFMTQVDALKKDNSMSDAQKQQVLYSLQSTMDLQVVEQFYIPEQRSFCQVSFAPEAFADQVTAPTAEEIQAAFEAKKDTYEGKVLDEVKETIAADLKAASANRLASEAAAQFAENYSNAFWKARETNADVQADAMMEQMAGELPLAHFERIEGLDFAHVDANNNIVLSAVFQANLTNPISGPVTGANAIYVTCLTGIVEGKLADPATSAEYYTLLKQSYRQNLGLAAAQVRAQDEIKRMTDALAANGNDFAAAAGELKFVDMPAFSVNDIYNQSASVRDFQTKSQVSPVLFLNDLAQLKAAGAFLPPQKAQVNFGQGLVWASGYRIFYVADRAVVEKTDDNAAEREKIRQRLQSQKENEELNSFFQMLLEQSTTELRPDLPLTSGM